MPKLSHKEKLLQSASTRTAGAARPLSSANPKVLTPDGQSSLPSVQSAGSTPTSTQHTPRLLTPISPANSRSKNDPQLLTGILKATVRMLEDLKLLTVLRLETGQIVILLADTYNNDSSWLGAPTVLTKKG